MPSPKKTIKKSVEKLLGASPEGEAAEPKSPDTKSSTKPRAKKIELMILDENVPLEMRVDIVRQLANSFDETSAPILAQVIQAASSAGGEDQFNEKVRELSELIQALQQGPLRGALFERMLDEPGLHRRAQVILPDGTLASPLVPDEGLAEKLRCGDDVWLDGKGTALLYHAPREKAVGEEAQLERVLQSGHVEVSVGALGRFVYCPSARLREQLDAGDAAPGSTVIVCARRMIAFLALPESSGLDHYEFLCREPVPDVVLSRDIGAPPAFISRILDHLRRELTDPGISARYRLRRSMLNLLSGIPGSGKTYGILALWNAMYTILAETIGVAVEDLPPRVMRLKSSTVLSKYLGESDQRIARFFKEVDQLAAETFEAPDGRVWELPVLVIAEEIDSIARSRGEDGVHDRIMASLLEGLDPGRAVFRDHLVFLLATTNTSHLVDMAVIRRIGGQIERFGLLNRFGFRAVLTKQLQGRVFRVGEAASADAARARTIADATTWLYAPNSEAPGQVEITFAGQANPVVMYARSFLTAGLVDRAVTEACDEAANAEYAGQEDPGLTTELVTRAIHAQVRNIVDLLTPQNCGQYLELPDGERVANVRRIEQPAAIPFELQRAS
jgi:hypothetical protein